MNSLQSFKGGKIILDLDEVKMICGNLVLFKGDSKPYDIGQEAADAVHGFFKSSSDEQQQEHRDTSTAPRPEAPSRPSTGSAERRE